MTAADEISDRQIVTHARPAWRERADFIIAAHMDGGDTDVVREQLWARATGERRFQICCIPFFLYDVALGDEVETDERFFLQRVVKVSGRYAFRAVFPAGSVTSMPDHPVAEQLAAMGALVEWYSPRMLAADATDAEHAQRLADFLKERETAGDLIYETARTR